MKEVFHDGYNPRVVRTEHESWLGFVRSMGDLNAESCTVLDACGRFLSSLDITEMVKSYKMVVLLVMLNADSIPGEISIEELVEKVSRFASRTAALRADFGDAVDDPRQMKRLLETNPIKAWVGGRGTGGASYFGYDAGVFSCTVILEATLRPAFQELLRELVEWRLSEYLGRAQFAETGDIICKVIHSSGRPILFLDRARHPDLPTGQTETVIDGESYLLDFVKITVNVARKAKDDSNELPRILRGWFGADAGLPGTRHAVVFTKYDGKWQLAPLQPRRPV